MRNSTKIGLLVGGIALLTAPAMAQDVTLNVYNAAGFEPYYVEQLIPAFEEATGINVEHVRISGGDLLGAVTAQVDSGESDIHLVIAGGSQLSQLADEGLVQELDLGQIGNIANLAGSPAEPYVGAWEGLAVPSHADYTPVVLAAASVDAGSIGDLDSLAAWICENPGRWQEGLAGRSGPGNGHKLAVAAALGEDLEDPDSWSAAWEYMAGVSSCIREYTAGTGPTISALGSGENLAIPMNYGWQAELRHRGEIPGDSQLVNPYGITFVDPHAMAVAETVDGDVLDAAHQFLNFQLTDDAQAMITNTIHYPLTISGWAASNSELRDRTTEMVTGIDFETFVADGDFSVMPSGSAQTRAFTIWEDEVGANHAYTGD
ncbi:MAG: PotD/PotF family extracellular solute-binding protein [Pseudomonadota bacterium]